MNPRYFIGISLPDDLTKNLEALQAKISAGQPVMDPLIPHITLLHPNILMTLSPLYFLPKVKILASEILPLEIELTKVDLFDTRVGYIAVTCPGLTQLQEQLVQLLPTDLRARYNVGREYVPHVTLAQSKPLQKLSEEYISKIKSEVEPLLPFTFAVHELTEFRQHSSRKYVMNSI